jgi:hypothetical protein
MKLSTWHVTTCKSTVYSCVHMHIRTLYLQVLGASLLVVSTQITWLPDLCKKFAPHLYLLTPRSHCSASMPLCQTYASYDLDTPNGPLCDAPFFSPFLVSLWSLLTGVPAFTDGTGPLNETGSLIGLTHATTTTTQPVIASSACTPVSYLHAACYNPLQSSNLSQTTIKPIPSQTPATFFDCQSSLFAHRPLSRFPHL